MLTIAEQAESDRKNNGFMAENPFTSAVEVRAMPWLLALGKAQGFTTRDAIERSLVCASVTGDQVTQQKISPQDTSQMCACLRGLGFQQQPHATKDDTGRRTRRWFLPGHMPGTSDTTKSESVVQGQKPVQQVDLLPTTQQHSDIYK